MINAKEAKARTDQAKQKLYNKDIERIEKAINEAISFGKHNVHILKLIDNEDCYLEIEPTAKKYLESLGYCVGSINEYINIVWL